MEMTKNAISWFEIPAVDFDRALAFYQKILDIEMHVMDMGPSKMGMLPHDSENGVGGAIVKAEGIDPAPSGGTRVYLNAGDDLLTVLNRVEGAGGSILIAKTHIGDGMGYYALFNDSEGNAVGLFSMN